MGVTSRSTICFIIGPSGDPARRALKSSVKPLLSANRDKNPFHAQSYQSQRASARRTGAPYLQTSRKRMRRPNDPHSVAGDMVATLLGADYMRLSLLQDRAHRIYFPSP